MNKNDPRLKNLIPYTTDREESCTAQVTIRIPPSVKAKLKHARNWHEKVRILLKQIADDTEPPDSAA